MSQTKRPLILAIETELHYEFGHVNCTFMTRNENGELFNWTEPWSSMIRSPKLPALDDMVITCQWSKNRPDADPHAWAAIYRQPSEVGLRQAQLMVKTLRTIEGIVKRKKLQDYVEGMTFGRYVQGIAQGMGVDEVLIVNSRPSAWLRDMEVAPVPMAEVAKVIDQTISDLRSGKASYVRIRS